MKIHVGLLTAVLLLFAIPAFAGDAMTIPILIQGDVVEIGPASDRKTVSDALSQILSSESLSVSFSERIQYDFFPVEHEPPLTVLFDFDQNGMFVRALIDAYTKEGNPVAVDLATWLESNVGEGEKVEDGIIWKYAGMLITLRDMPAAGEDSVYQIEIEKQ